MNPNDAQQLIEQNILVLEHSAAIFVEQLPSPIYIDKPVGHFEYKNPDERTFAVLRCVRIVADLRAASHLLAAGFVQQVGVLIRTTLEFSNDLDLIFEGSIQQGTPTSSTEKVERFFSEVFPNIANLVNETKKAPTIPRKKVYAVTGRLLGGRDPFRIQQIAKTEEDVYSGYVHGNYHHVMELYNENRKKFEMMGQPDLIHSWQHNLAPIVHHVLNQFLATACLFGLQELSKVLIKQRVELESSALYENA